RHLIEVLAPFGFGHAGEQTVEVQVLALAIEAGGGEYLDVRVGVPILLHVEVAVELAGGNDEAHLAELVKRRAQARTQPSRRVDEQSTAWQPNDGHPSAYLETEIAKRLLR